MFLIVVVICFQLLLSSKDYPDPWGDGMQEVVAGDPEQKEGTQWIVNFVQLPNPGEFNSL